MSTGLIYGREEQDLRSYFEQAYNSQALECYLPSKNIKEYQQQIFKSNITIDSFIKNKSESGSKSKSSLNKNSSKKISAFSKENDNNNDNHFNLNLKNIGVVNVDQISQFIIKLSFEEIAEFPVNKTALEEEDAEVEETEEGFSNMTSNIIK